MDSDSPALTSGQTLSVDAQTARAERFAVQAPMLCRIAPYSPWHNGQIENISTTGVLFRSDIRLGVQRRLDMSFTLTDPVAGVPPSSIVVCQGRIVRVASRDDGSTAFGVAIEHQRFVRVCDP
jgi:hypothetical protein